ncbi:uncharacterized protein LOC144887578 [Branchiostoma floridae x Branchiostoma japonicum]
MGSTDLKWDATFCTGQKYFVCQIGPGDEDACARHETTTETNDVSTVYEAVTTVKAHEDMTAPGDLTIVDEQPNLTTPPGGLTTKPPGGLTTEEQPDLATPPGGLTTTGQPGATVPIGGTAGIEVTPTDEDSEATAVTIGVGVLAAIILAHVILG